MPIEQNFLEFYKSINIELTTVKNRVRNIIGDSHWGQDGLYKEAVLRNVISRFLPGKYRLGTGFVINSKRILTRQIDIIVYDNTVPMLFREGDFIIAPANSVRGIIEVKTEIRSKPDLKDYIETSEENGKIIKTKDDLPNTPFFNGIFSYSSTLNVDTLREELGSYFFQTKPREIKKVNNISLGEDVFIKLFNDSRDFNNDVGDSQNDTFSLRGYFLESLSFAYFISNLLFTLEKHQHRRENESLYFPHKSKDSFEKFVIYFPYESMQR